MVEEYGRKFIGGDLHRWETNHQRKATMIQDVGILYTFRGDMVNFQGNLLKARTMLQIPQCRKEVEVAKREKCKSTSTQ